jgi:hypothetical protein
MSDYGPARNSNALMNSCWKKRVSPPPSFYLWFSGVMHLYCREVISYYRIAMIVYHHMILTTIASVPMLMMTSSVEPAMELACLLGIMIHIDLHALQPNQSAVRVRSPADHQTTVNTGVPTYYYLVYKFSGPDIQFSCVLTHQFGRIKWLWHSISGRAYHWWQFSVIPWILLLSVIQRWQRSGLSV